MLIDLLKELALELLRALFLEEFCQRVREGLARRVRLHRSGRRAWLRQLHIRHRERLLHRLTTDRLPKL